MLRNYGRLAHQCDVLHGNALGSRLLTLALLATQLATIANAQVASPAPPGFEPPAARGGRQTDDFRRDTRSPNHAPSSTSRRGDDGELDAELTVEERRNIRVYQKANRSAVNITTRAVRAAYPFVAETAEGSGSGSILDRKGHILTNMHVIEDAQEIRVTLYTGEAYDARIVGQDDLNDIAVLKISAPASDLNPLPLGDASRLRVGQRIYAIGNPFGLERTMTTGIISSLNRTLPARDRRRMKSIIQIDAALNQGNSGGPLLNSRAELIGMNTAIASRTGENTGIGFAIPISTIRRVVPQLILNGRVIRPTTGIVTLQTDRGLVVAQLEPGGPGDEAGLHGFRLVRERMQRGPYLYERTRVDQSHADVILAIDDQPIETRDEFLTYVEQKSPGDTVKLSVLRDGKKLDVFLVLGESED